MYGAQQRGSDAVTEGWMQDRRELAVWEQPGKALKGSGI